MIKLTDILKEQEGEMEVNVDTNDRGIKNPSFVFEINGNFNFKELETILRYNEQGLTLDNFELKINTKGDAGDGDYENFIREVEKLRYLKFIR